MKTVYADTTARISDFNPETLVNDYPMIVVAMGIGLLVVMAHYLIK